jgi:transcription factor IIIB subunit 2
LLKLQLPPTTDASIYLISLVKSIPSLIDHDSQLPASLRTFISPLSLESVLLLATSIAAIANSVFLTHNRYLPAVACAFLMVALEGERGSELPSVGEFAAQLAKQVNSSKRTVMERYREVGRLLQDWKSELPWVGQTTSKAKIQRKDNSRWIKDVVTFQEECRRAEWTKQAAGAQALDFAFEEIDSDLDDVDASTDQTFCAASDDDELPRSPHERKQRRLDAKSAPETDRIRPAAYVHPPQPANVLHQRALKTAVSSLLARGDVDNTLQNQMSLQSLRSFILTTGTLPTDSAPSRLAQLAAAKGVDAVEDDELFDEGELERIMRPADEVEEVREHLEQKWGSAPPKEENALIGTGSVDSDGRRRKPRTKAKKVTDSASDEVISAWRPVSPGPQFDDGYTFSEDVGG